MDAPAIQFKDDKTLKQWALVPMPLRIDAFNLSVIEERIQKAVALSQQLALDLTNTQFLSVPFILGLHRKAEQLRLSGGELILIGVGERIKKQVHVYASLEPMQIVRSLDLWKRQEGISELKDSHIF